MGDRIPGETRGSTEAQGRQTCRWEKGKMWSEGRGCPKRPRSPLLFSRTLPRPRPHSVLGADPASPGQPDSPRSPPPWPSPAAGAGSALKTPAAEETHILWRAPAHQARQSQTPSGLPDLSQAPDNARRACPSATALPSLALGSNITGGACCHTPAQRSWGRVQFWPGGS